MTDSNVWIFAERNSSSDTDIAVNEVFFSNGTSITAGEVAFELEGAKAVFEVESPSSGYFYSLVSRDDKVGVNAPIAVISDSLLTDIPKYEDDADTLFDGELSSSPGEPNNSNYSATNAAKELADSIGFDLSQLSHLGLITKEAVQAAAPNNELTQSWRSFPKVRLLILGGGPHATLVAEVANSDASVSIIGVLDDQNNLLNELGVPLLGRIEESVIKNLHNNKAFSHIAIGVGANMQFRRNWLKFCTDNDIPLATLIHKNAFVSNTASIGQGALIMDTARVGPFAVLGANVFVSAGTNIEHHCEIGENTTFGPGVQLSGGVKIGACCGFGTQIGIEPSINVGDNCQIASGSIITSDVKPGTTIKSSGKRVDR